MRKATADEVDSVIMPALLALKASGKAAKMKYTDPVVARGHLLYAVRHELLWIMGGYMVLVDYGRDWYGPHNFLFEQMILKVYPEDRRFSVDDVIAVALPTLRDYFSCVAIIAGDTQVGYMIPKYEAQGYVRLGVQLIKEKPEWVQSESSPA
jgi:hypothetical protein